MLLPRFTLSRHGISPHLGHKPAAMVEFDSPARYGCLHAHPTIEISDAR
jgi:hypothetical protein